MATTIFFSVDDTSPTVNYAPFRDTFGTPALAAGWNPYFTTSGFAPAQGAQGVGTSQHITALDGAQLSVSWRGTGITLRGNTTSSASYSLTLDGQDLGTTSNLTDPSSSVLATFANLTDATHTLSLTARIPGNDNSSLVVFEKADLVAVSGTSASGSGNDASAPPILQPLNDSTVAFLGQWSFLPSTEPAVSPSRQSVNTGDRAVAKFIGTSLLLFGTTSPTSGNYSVILDPDPAAPPDGDADDGTAFSARSSFTDSNTLLFYTTGLDPSTTHTVEVRNTGGGTLGLRMNGFAVWTGVNGPSPPISSSSSSSSTSATVSPISGSTTAEYSRGTIAAFALAGILAFLLLSALLFFLFVWRPRRRRQRAMRGREERYTFKPPPPTGKPSHVAGGSMGKAEGILGIGLGMGIGTRGKANGGSRGDGEGRFTFLPQRRSAGSRRTGGGTVESVMDIGPHEVMDVSASTPRRSGHGRDATDETWGNRAFNTASTQRDRDSRRFSSARERDSRRFTRNSNKSGFERWKREMEGAPGTGAGLPIDFRHSDVLDEKGWYGGDVEGYAEGKYTGGGEGKGYDGESKGYSGDASEKAYADDGYPYSYGYGYGWSEGVGEESVPLSAKSSRFSISSSLRVKRRSGSGGTGHHAKGSSGSLAATGVGVIGGVMGKGKGKNKGKGKEKGRRDISGSWSPKFALALPLRAPGERSKEGGEEDEEEDHPGIATLSYIPPRGGTVPPTTPRNLAEPPSYAVSVSNRDSNNSSSNPNSAPTPPSGFPRSVTNTQSTPSPPRDLQQQHMRKGSRGYLLQYGDPNPGSPEEEYDASRQREDEGDETYSRRLSELARQAEARPLGPRRSMAQWLRGSMGAAGSSGTGTVTGTDVGWTGGPRVLATPPREGSSGSGGYGSNGASEDADFALRSLSPRTSKARSVGTSASRGSPTNAPSMMSQLPPPPPPPMMMMPGPSSSATAGMKKLPPLPIQTLAQQSAPADPSSSRQNRAPTRAPGAATTLGEDEEMVEVKNGIFLSVRETSPFRIDFPSAPRPLSAAQSQAPSTDSPTSDVASPVTRVSGLSHVRFDQGAMAEIAAAAAAAAVGGQGTSSRRSIGNVLGIDASEDGAEDRGTFGQGRSMFRLTPLTIHPIPPTPSSQSPPDESGSAGALLLPSGAGVSPESAGVTSFLDLTGGSDTSLRSRSNYGTTDSSERERAWDLLQVERERSRWSNTTAPSVMTNQERAVGETSSSMVSPIMSESQSLVSSTFPIPFQVSIPPSPHIAEHLSSTRNTEQRISANSDSDNLHVHPQLENIESPTESIPMSVSDLHFRHSNSDHSRRTSSNPHFPTHPPLPERDTEASAVSTPSYMVQRVLGMDSPSASITGRLGHSRSGSDSAFFTPLPSALGDIPTGSSRSNSSPDNPK